MSNFDLGNAQNVSFVNRFIRMCPRPDFAELMQQSLQELLDDGNDDPGHRIAIGQNLTTRVSSIAFAARAANRNQSVSTEIFECTKAFVEQYPLTGDVIAGSQELTDKVTDLTLQARLRPR